MASYSVNMSNGDPVHEVAYARIRRLITANRAFVDSIVKSTPAKLAQNWKLALVREDPNLIALRDLWRRDWDFQEYLKEKLIAAYGDEYTAGLIRVFLK